MDQPTIFMVALANLLSELVNTIITKIMEPLEGDPEFAPNEEVGEWESCTKLYFGNFKI